MLKSLWKRVCRFREYEAELARTQRDQQGVESLVNAWKCLNALAEETWKIAQDKTFPDGITRHSLNDYKSKLIKTYRDWNSAFIDHLEISASQSDRFFLNSGETLRTFWGVCEFLNSVDQKDNQNLEFTREELLSELAAFLTENDLEALQRDRSPQPISPSIIEYSERTRDWMEMPEISHE